MSVAPSRNDALRVPSASTLRLIGDAAEAARARLTPPLGARFTSDAPAWAIVLGPKDAADASSVARALPAPETLVPGALLFVLPLVVEPSLGSRFLAALGRGRTVPRALRATALVARGYVGVGAGTDRETRTDLVWGFAPPVPT